MTVTYHNGIYSLDRPDFTIKGVAFLITGTRKVTGPFGTWFECDVKNVKTKKYKTMRHQSLAEIIMKENDNN